MTLSILGRCDETGMLGMAIACSSIATASRSRFARAGVGIAAIQNRADPSLGPKALALMESDLDAETSLATLLSDAPHASFRQIALLDAEGRSAAFSGDAVSGYHGHSSERDCVAIANMLSNESVPSAMTDAFANSSGHLAWRLFSALESGLVGGGEKGPVHSAGLLVVHVHGWPLIDLRVDWAESGAVAQLREIWQLYEPRMDEFLQAAIDPGELPVP